MCILRCGLGRYYYMRYCVMGGRDQYYMNCRRKATNAEGMYGEGSAIRRYVEEFLSGGNP